MCQEKCIASDFKSDGIKHNRDSCETPHVDTVKTRIEQKNCQRHSDDSKAGNCAELQSSLSSRVSHPAVSPSKSVPLSAVLTCPRHASFKSLSELVSCAECNLLAQSQPSSMINHSRSHSRQQSIQSSKFSSVKSPKLKSKLVKKQKLNFKKVNKSQRKGTGSAFSSAVSDPGGGVALQSSSLSRYSTMCSSNCLSIAEVVISPLSKSAISAVIHTKSSEENVCNMSDMSDIGEEDSVVRTVCSESEPLPVEHCRKRKGIFQELDTSKKKKRSKGSSRSR